jgi:hypothetical protein
MFSNVSLPDKEVLHPQTFLRSMKRSRHAFSMHPQLNRRQHLPSERWLSHPLWKRKSD